MYGTRRNSCLTRNPLGRQSHHSDTHIHTHLLNLCQLWCHVYALKYMQVSKLHTRKECIVQTKGFCNFVQRMKIMTAKSVLQCSVNFLTPPQKTKKKKQTKKPPVIHLLKKWYGRGSDRKKEVLLSFGRATAGEKSVCNISTCRLSGC